MRVDALAGKALAAATRGLAAVRPAVRPLHPSGVLISGRLLRHGASPQSGVQWLDSVGEDEVLVRVSRAVGLPPSFPDIRGLALRAPTGPGTYADVLLASTGWNRIGRHLLVPRWTDRCAMSTLLPYRSESGPVVLGARPNDEGGFTLSWARPPGSWRPFADLHLGDPAPDAVVSFDPLRHVPPGLDHYPWVTRIREPSYAKARSTRDSEQ